MTYRIRLLLMIILTLVIVTNNNTLSQTQYTNYSIFGGFGAGLNSHSSDFAQLPGIPNCCNKFESATNFGYGLYVGGEYRFDKLIESYTSKYVLRLNYANLSGNYNVEENIGNLLHLDTYENIWVDHKLDVAYSSILTEHFFQISKPDFIPLELRIGFVFGIVLGKSFNQREEIASPQGINFENGSPIRQEFSGDLPDANPLYLGLALGTSYKVANMGNLDVLADLQYTYGLSNVISDYDWKISTLRAGVTFRYNIAKPELPRPVVIPADEPKMPIPPKAPEAPVIAIRGLYEGREISSGDTLTAFIKRDNYIYYLNYLPVLFFEKGATKPNERSIQMQSVPESDERAFFNILSQNDFAVKYADILSEQLKAEPGKILTIKSISDDDEADIIALRGESIKSQLIAKGIASERIILKNEILKGNDFNYTELIDETRKVIFEIDGVESLIQHNIESMQLLHNTNKIVFLQTFVESESEITYFEGSSSIEGANPTKLKNGQNELLLNSSIFVNESSRLKTLTATAKIENEEKQTAETKIQLYLKHEETANNIYINASSQLSQFSYFVLAYSEFDKSDFFAIDNTALKYIKSKIAEGKSITLYPLTDDLGTPEYNNVLARKRGESAVRLIGVKPQQLTVDYDSPITFSTDTPYGRILSRTVIVRIDE
jgi:outer membrane protein OmpA-like peptidoglycan-associated protein